MTQHASKQLDLTQIHPRIIIIGSPYTNNTLQEVRNYLKKSFTHPNNSPFYTIFNFASEAEYNIEQDIENVITYGFPEFSPCPFEYLIHICSLIDGYLNRSSENVVILHSRQGKGRSCLIAGCLLLLLAHVKSASEAISLIRDKRGNDALTLPSQIRYLYYYDRLLRRDGVATNTFQLLTLRINTIPKFNSSIVQAGCAPFFTIEVFATDQTQHRAYLGNNGGQELGDPLAFQRQYVKKKVFESFNPSQSNIKLRSPKNNSVSNTKTSAGNTSSGPLQYRTNYDEMIEFDLSNHPVVVRGDIVITFYHYSNNSQKYEKMFHLTVYSGFIEKPLSAQLAAAINASSPNPTGNTQTSSSLNHNLYYQSFQKIHIDDASSDIYHDTFDEKFSVELLFQQKENQPAINEFTEDEYYSIVDTASAMNNMNLASSLNASKAARSTFTTSSIGKLGQSGTTNNFFTSQFN